MSSNWYALHAQLVRSVNRHSSLDHFIELFPPGGPDCGFRDPSMLLGWLHARDGDAEAKNDVLVRLWQAADTRDRCGNLAVELLLLALWPGLSTVRYRLRSFPRADTLDADLVGSLTIGIRKNAERCVTRVAATLLLNLDRDLRRLYRRDDRVVRSLVDMEAVANKLAHEAPERPEHLITAAYAELGTDGLLLAAVHVAGFTQKEAGVCLGISHDAARKRCQRALVRLKHKNVT